MAISPIEGFQPPIKEEVARPGSPDQVLDKEISTLFAMMQEPEKIFQAGKPETLVVPDKVKEFLTTHGLSEAKVNALLPEEIRCLIESLVARYLSGLRSEHKEIQVTSANIKAIVQGLTEFSEKTVAQDHIPRLDRLMEDPTMKRIDFVDEKELKALVDEFNKIQEETYKNSPKFKPESVRLTLTKTNGTYVLKGPKGFERALIKALPNTREPHRGDIYEVPSRIIQEAMQSVYNMVRGEGALSETDELEQENDRVLYTEGELKKLVSGLNESAEKARYAPDVPDLYLRGGVLELTKESNGSYSLKGPNGFLVTVPPDSSSFLHPPVKYALSRTDERAAEQILAQETERVRAQYEARLTKRGYI